MQKKESGEAFVAPMQRHFRQIKCEKILKEEHKQCYYGARHANVAKSSG